MRSCPKPPYPCLIGDTMLGFVLVNLVVLSMGFLIRNKGMTWLIAGYDASQVRDEKGLARWAGTGVMAVGAVGLVIGGVIAVLPDLAASGEDSRKACPKPAYLLMNGITSIPRESTGITK